MPRRPILILAVAVLVAAAALAAFAFLGLPQQNGTGTGRALVGGPFSLTDHTGRRVTEKDFLGRYMLVFFGYTYCPDVCPTELQVMTAALDELKEAGDAIVPVFITVDPERDTPDTVRAYVENFSPRLVGLSGTLEEIAAVAKAYRVYYARSGEGKSEDYLMDHSSIIYLMGPDGTLVRHFGYTTDARQLAAELKDAITGSS